MNIKDALRECDDSLRGRGRTTGQLNFLSSAIVDPYFISIVGQPQYNGIAHIGIGGCHTLLGRTMNGNIMFDHYIWTLLDGGRYNERYYLLGVVHNMMSILPKDITIRYGDDTGFIRDGNFWSYFYNIFNFDIPITSLKGYMGKIYEYGDTTLLLRPDFSSFVLLKDNILTKIGHINVVDSY